MGKLSVKNAALGMVLLLSGISPSLSWAEELPLFDDPALLLDNMTWLKAQKSFRELGTETRSYLDLVTILYDWDNQRPWPNYSAEANKRLNKFRENLCDELSLLPICQKPLMLSNAKDVGIAQAAMIDAPARKILEQRWGLHLTTWFLPGKTPIFSMLVGTSVQQQSLQAAYWDLNPEVHQLTIFQDEILADAANYRAGFDSKEVPTYLALNPEGAAINDRQLKQRAVELAEAWKHAVAANRKNAPSHAIAGATEIQFQRLFDAKSAEFQRTHNLLEKKIAHLPVIAKRFQAEREQNDFAGEVYQHMAYAELKDLAEVQANYFSLAQTQRSSLSDRQKALESLLTLQRYSQSPQTLALELTTLIEPLSSHAFLLNQNIDSKLAMTFVLENLRAVLGLGNYAGQALFPKYGQGLKDPVLFESNGLAEVAPEALELLHGRKFETLSEAEQAKVLETYLEPVPGKIRSMALMRMATLFYSTAGTEELRLLAGIIHQRIYEKTQLAAGFFVKSH